MLLILYNGLLLPLRTLAPLYALIARARGASPDEIEQRFALEGRGAHGAVSLPEPLPDSERPLWMQAASVGEVGVAAILITALERARPGLRFHLTTTTRTGQSVARRSLEGRARLGFFPLDFRGAVRRTLDRIRPAALLLVETELWPNLILEAARREIPILLANGRLSDRAFRRYRLAAPLLAESLRSLRIACLQTELDRDRFVRLGLPPERARITGNLKFAAPVAVDDPSSLLAALRIDGREIWLAGSTAEGEEDIVIRAFLSASREAPQRVLVLAPRRPERFDAVAKILERSGVSFIRRSSPMTAPSAPRIVLLDSLGELSALYRAATVAFIGGTLAPIGGHNIIEPAAHGLAPIFGPHIENVREVASRLLEVGGAFQVSDERGLVDLFQRLGTQPETRLTAGHNARDLVQRSARALDDTVREILPFLQAPRAAASS